MSENLIETRLQRPADLPDFEKPPIDEVAISIQFQSIATIMGDATAMFREVIKEDFPGVEYQPRLGPTSPPFETIIAPWGVTPQVQASSIESRTQETSPRVWLVTKDGSQLIQLQDDRFIFNWRRGGGTDYPRFESVLQDFWLRFRAFRKVIADLGSRLEPQLFELSYYNWIMQQELAQSDAVKAMAAAKLNPSESVAVQEQQGWLGSYRLMNNGVSTARLNIQSQGQIIRVERVSNQIQQGSVLNLSYISSISPGAMDETLEKQLLSGRRAIVESFYELTTEQAHTHWGLRS